MWSLEMIITLNKKAIKDNEESKEKKNQTKD